MAMDSGDSVQETVKRKVEDSELRERERLEGQEEQNRERRGERSEEEQ